jgi:CubicO group peptidase (beta-lactamase class C family)
VISDLVDFNSKNQTMKNIFLFSITLLLTTIFVFSCDKDDDAPPATTTIETAEELTAALDNIYASAEAPGFAVSVVKNDAIIYQEAFGKADIAAGKDFTNQTLLPIGSISKTFIAAAVVKAIEEGYFTLETNINDLLPFEVNNPKQPNTAIKVKHLVTHTSGLLDAPDYYLAAYHILPGEDLTGLGAQILTEIGAEQRQTIALGDFLAAYYLPDGEGYSPDNFANTAPGNTWNYSNIASSLAAYLVEVATGKDFKVYVQENVFQPLGMDDTAYDLADLDAQHVAQLYWDEQTPFPKYTNDSYPDGGIHTSNEDLGKYLTDMMKGAQGQSTTLFSQASYEMLLSALLPSGVLPTYVGENQGVFWFLGNGFILHDGSDPGTACDLRFNEEGTVGSIIMTNMDASTDEHEEAFTEVATAILTAINEFSDAN